MKTVHSSGGSRALGFYSVRWGRWDLLSRGMRVLDFVLNVISLAAAPRID